MSQLNANIPYIQCYVKDAYLFQDFTNKDLTSVYIFGVKAVLNSPLLFHCQLDNGVVWWSLPISAFVHKENFEQLSDVEEERLSLLQYWNMQSSDIAVTQFAYLQDYKVDCFGRDKKFRRGKYLFTIDDYYSDLNNLPLGYAQDGDKKCFHIVELENGNYCAYPNNYLRWHNLNHCEPFTDPPKYKRNNIKYNCEYIK
jgi:hypothetical protein